MHSRHNKFGAIQRGVWQWLKDLAKKIGPVDIMLHAGDWIDGRGEKSGCTELVEVSQMEQCKMAIQFVGLFKPKMVRTVYGSPYHQAA